MKNNGGEETVCCFKMSVRKKRRVGGAFFFHELFLKDWTARCKQWFIILKSSCYNSHDKERGKKKKPKSIFFCKYFVKWKNYRRDLEKGSK